MVFVATSVLAAVSVSLWIQCVQMDLKRKKKEM